MELTSALDGLTPEAMVKAADVLSGKDGAQMDALEMYVWLKRVQGLAEAVMKNILPEANAEFQKKVAHDPAAKAWKAAEFATVASYTPAGTWTYPKELVAQEAALKDAKEAAKYTGAAVHTPASVDPAKTAMFKVQLQRI